MNDNSSAATNEKDLALFFTNLMIQGVSIPFTNSDDIKKNLIYTFFNQYGYEEPTDDYVNNLLENSSVKFVVDEFIDFLDLLKNMFIIYDKLQTQMIFKSYYLFTSKYTHFIPWLEWFPLYHMISPGKVTTSFMKEDNIIEQLSNNINQFVQDEDYNMKSFVENKYPIFISYYQLNNNFRMVYVLLKEVDQQTQLDNNSKLECLYNLVHLIRKTTKNNVSKAIDIMALNEFVKLIMSPVSKNYNMEKIQWASMLIIQNLSTSLHDCHGISLAISSGEVNLAGKVMYISHVANTKSYFEKFKYTDTYQSNLLKQIENRFAGCSLLMGLNFKYFMDQEIDAFKLENFGKLAGCLCYARAAQSQRLKIWLNNGKSFEEFTSDKCQQTCQQSGIYHSFDMLFVKDIYTRQNIKFISSYFRN